MIRFGTRLSSSSARSCGLALAALTLTASLCDAQQKRVYINNDDHTDYIWSALEDPYKSAFLAMLDYYLDLADSTQTNASDYQSRFAADGSFWMWTYEKNRTPAQFQRLIDRIADGHITVPMNGLAVCLGGAPAEAVLRGMYYPGRIERKHGVRFRIAYEMENQSQPFGLWSMWAGSGVKYSWKGICNCASDIVNPWDREHDIYRAVGLDGSSVLVKWNSQLVGNAGMGGYAEARDPNAIVDYVTSNAPFNGFAARYPYDVTGAFGKGWDDIQTTTNEFIGAAIAKTNASRRVIVSNQLDFFADFEATYNTANLPTESWSFGNEWELDATTLAEVVARVKRSMEKLRAAEAMASLVSLSNPAFMNGRETARDQAWTDLSIFYEHNFGMWGNPTGQAGIDQRILLEKRYATNIESYVDPLHADAATELGRKIATTASNPRFFAFNPLSWTRTDFADFAWSDTNPFHVVDVTTGLEVPSQIVATNGPRRIRIQAPNVPSLGYKVFEIVPGAGASFTNAATVTLGNSVVENALVKITLAPRGAITSFVDKANGNREYVRVVGGKAMNDLGAGSGSLALESQGPVSTTLIATSSSVLAHTTRITLYRDSSRVDVQNDINQNFDVLNTWSFGFELDTPVVRHEEVGAILKAALVANGGHYSPRQARYDWMTLNHFVDISGTGNVGMTLGNADCSFFRFGNSTNVTLDTAQPWIRVAAGGRIGNPGVANQGGDTHFLQRFALKTHANYDPVAAMKFALEHQDALVTGAVTGTAAVLAPDNLSVMSASDPSVLVWALKPAEDGAFAPGGPLTARLWNVSEAPTTTTIQVGPSPISSALVATHTETIDATLGSAPSVAANGATASFTAQQMRTFRLGLDAPVAFCSGDGSATACPCGNVGSAAAGCANSLNASGATLAWTGVTSVSANSFALVGARMPNSSALYFQGTAQQNGGAGSVFGDGLRCVAGNVLRLGTLSNASGGSSLAVNAAALGLNAGDVRFYQCWYRNAAAFCTSSTFNLTNGLSVTWRL